MWAGDRLEHRLVGIVADAPALNGEVEKSLGAEVPLVPEFGDENGATVRRTGAFEHNVVEPFERNFLVALMPNDLRNKPYDGHDDVGDHQQRSSSSPTRSRASLFPH